MTCWPWLVEIILLEVFIHFLFVNLSVYLAGGDHPPADNLFNNMLFWVIFYLAGGDYPPCILF